MRRAIDIVLMPAALLCGMALMAQPQSQPAQEGRGRGAAPAMPLPLVLRETFNTLDKEGNFTGANGSPESVTPQYVRRPPFGQRPLLLSDVSSADHELKWYGSGAPPKPDHESGLQLESGIDPVTGSPVTWVWSGMTEGLWALTVRDKRNYVDLSGLGRIRWRIRLRGLHQLRPIVKLADGTMLVGEYVELPSTQWREDEFYLVDVPRWRVIDSKEVITSTQDAAIRMNPDLTKVDEIGFTDLMRGSGHGFGGSSSIDWIEVYGKPVMR